MGSKEAETVTRRRLVVATSALGGIAVVVTGMWVGLLVVGGGGCGS